jgi:hypothetical protein
MIRQLLDLIEDHPALRHGMFAKLAERKLPPRTLADFLRLMGAVCEASRPGLSLGDTLRQVGFPNQADQVVIIFESEDGHEHGFEEMAQILLARSPEANKRFIYFTWFQTPALDEVRRIFARRGESSREAALYSLGVMLVVEMVAHRQVIPAEVAAFVDSGHYGFRPSIPYLAEHAGEDGAEIQHELTIIAIIRSFEDRTDFSEADWVSVRDGCEAILAAFAAWYDELDQILRS